ncbi:MAG: PadR family transcriptional regulator [Desulfocucumaceae bacterium]
MSLPHALLGLLNYQPATGYELKTTFERSVNFFWNATLPQIYRTLNQMEERGWLTATIEQQESKPNRKVYSITGTGRKEFLSWLAEPTETAQPRSPMLLKVFFGRQMEGNSLVNHLLSWREHHLGLIKRYEEEVVPVIQHYAALTGAAEEARYWALTQDFGLRYAKMVVEWCDMILAAQDRGGS